MKKLILLAALSFSTMAWSASVDDMPQEQINTLEEVLNLLKEASISSKKIYQCTANMAFEYSNGNPAKLYDTYRGEGEVLSDAEDMARLRCNSAKASEPSLKDQAGWLFDFITCKIQECSAIETPASKNQSELSLGLFKQLAALAQMLKPPRYLCQAVFMHNGTPWKTFRGEGNSLSEAQKNAFNFCANGRLIIPEYEWIGRYPRPECELLPCEKIAE